MPINEIPSYFGNEKIDINIIPKIYERNTITSKPIDILKNNNLNVQGAYSFRKLSNNYTGNCLRVSKDNDSSFRDIGFGVDGYVNEMDIFDFMKTVEIQYPNEPNLESIDYFSTEVYICAEKIESGMSISENILKIKVPYDTPCGCLIEVKYKRKLSTDTIFTYNTINSFVANVCYISYWYDQSGYNYNIGQTDNKYRPVIFRDGDFIRENGKLIVEFDKGCHLTCTNPITGEINIPKNGSTVFGIMSFQNPRNNNIMEDTNIFRISDSSKFMELGFLGGLDEANIRQGFSFEITTQSDTFKGTKEIGSSYYNKLSTMWIYRNSKSMGFYNNMWGILGLSRPTDIDVTYSSTGNLTYAIGGNFISISEFIYVTNELHYNTIGYDVSLEQNKYYKTTEYLLDKYPGAEVAYGMRRLKSDYEKGCINVSYIDTNLSKRNKDIGFDSQGNLDLKQIKELYDNGIDQEIEVNIIYDQSGNGHHLYQQNRANLNEGAKLITRVMQEASERKMVNCNNKYMLFCDKAYYTTLNNFPFNKLYKNSEMEVFMVTSLSKDYYDCEVCSFGIGELYDEGYFLKLPYLKAIEINKNRISDTQNLMYLDTKDTLVQWNIAIKDRFLNFYKNSKLFKSFILEEKIPDTDYKGSFRLGFSKDEDANNFTGLFGELVIYNTNKGYSRELINKNQSQYYGTTHGLLSKSKTYELTEDVILVRKTSAIFGLSRLNNPYKKSLANFEFQSPINGINSIDMYANDLGELNTDAMARQFSVKPIYVNTLYNQNTIFSGMNLNYITGRITPPIIKGEANTVFYNKVVNGFNVISFFKASGGQCGCGFKSNMEFQIKAVCMTFSSDCISGLEKTKVANTCIFDSYKSDNTSYHNTIRIPENSEQFDLTNISTFEINGTPISYFDNKLFNDKFGVLYVDFNEMISSKVWIGSSSSISMGFAGCIGEIFIFRESLTVSERKGLTRSLLSKYNYN